MRDTNFLQQVLPYVFVFFASFDIIYNLLIKKSPVSRSVFFVAFFMFAIMFYSFVKRKDESRMGIRVSERIILFVTVLSLGFMFFAPFLGVEKYWQLAAPPLIFIGIYVLIAYLVLPFFEGINAVQVFCKDHDIQLNRGPLKADFVPSIFYSGDLASKEQETIPFVAVSDVVEISPEFKMFTNTYKSYVKEGYLIETQFCVAVTVAVTRHYHRILLHRPDAPFPIHGTAQVRLPEIAEKYAVVSDDEAEVNEVIGKISGPLLRLSSLFDGATVMDGTLTTDLDIHIRDKYLFARMGYVYRNKIESIYMEFRDIQKALG